jgi:uncharacterized membrane protein
MNDVRMIYEVPSRAPALLASYGVDYIVVGDAEREAYDVRLPADSIEEVFSQNDTTLYRVLVNSA